MPAVLLKNAKKQLHQSFKAVKHRVDVVRSSSFDFDGFSRGMSFSQNNSPGVTSDKSVSPSFMGKARSILDGTNISFPMLEESGSRGVGSEDFSESTSAATPTDNCIEGSSHLLQNFMHKFSSFGSSVGSPSGGETPESIPMGMFGHRQRRTDLDGAHNTRFNLVRRQSEGSDTDHDAGYAIQGRNGHDRRRCRHNSFSRVFGRNLSEAEDNHLNSVTDGPQEIVNRGLHSMKKNQRDSNGVVDS